MEKNYRINIVTNNANEPEVYNVPFFFKEFDKFFSIPLNYQANDSTKQIIDRAFTFHKKGKIFEAAKCYQILINQKTKDPKVFFNLGAILKDVGRLQEAEKCYLNAIRYNPGNAESYFNLGNILRDLGKLHDAELSQRKAIELKPDFAEAHSNLGLILKGLGKLKEAEKFYLKAIELKPYDKNFKSNLISLLSIYNPIDVRSNIIYRINKEFNGISLPNKQDNLITDHDVIQLYLDGLKIYRKYNLDLEVNSSQIYKRNNKSLDCKRHFLIFNQKNIIPEFCFSCYKVQVETKSIIELLKIFIVFNYLELKNNNTRKCMLETRSNISGFYKGLIYCLSLDEAYQISNQLDMQIKNNIRSDLTSKVKRGCSEYPLKFPKFKEIRQKGDQPMEYKEDWRSIEKEYDKGRKEWGKSIEEIEGFNLNNFLIMRNWIAYAQKIGDHRVDKITDERIKGSTKVQLFPNRI